MKKAVAEGQKTMDMVVRAAADPGGYRVMEMGPAASSLPLCLASPSSWSCSETLEVDVGWGPDFQEKSKKFIAEVREQKPDLLVIRPVPWLLRAAEGDEQLWERRRLQLPLWHVVLELWKLQDEAGRLVVLSQPVASEALFLTFLKERREVLRVVVARCAFAEDGQALRPQPEELYLDVNEGKFATALQYRSWCQCPPAAHARSCHAGSGPSSGWPARLCRHVLAAAEQSLMANREASYLGLADAVPSSEARIWETAPVSSASVPEENLRKALQENGATGERFDFVTFEGPSLQQPRRLRHTVAHLHVTLGHPSNERLARMLVLSGGQKSVVELANNLRCQVCSMVQPPHAMPQVAYTKPKQFNERVSGDTFFVWDQAGTKFAVTHFIDGLTDYHLGDLTDRPDSSFSREVLQDLWYATFGPPDLLLTDGGTEFAGHVEILNQLFGVVREIIPEGAKWRMGQAERHGAIVKLMIMRMAKALSLKGLDGMRQAALAAFSAKNRLMNKGGVSPIQGADALPVQPGDGDQRGIREGAVVYVYDPPNSRRGQARRLQDNESWSGPGVIFCVERDTPVPQRLWVRLRGRVKAFPLEKVRLATIDEMASAQYVRESLAEVEKELQGGQLLVEDSSSSSSSSSEEDMAANEEKRVAEQDGPLPTDPHELDFAKKRRLFEKLAKDLEPPTTLQEGQIRDHLSKIYGSEEGDEEAEEVDVGEWFRPGEYEAMFMDTVGHWTLWSASSNHAGEPGLTSIAASLKKVDAEAMAEGVTQVKTGKACVEYRWGDLSPDWRKAFVEPLKKAVGVYLDHHGIQGVPKGQVVDPQRVLSSRFVLTNKGADDLTNAELKARWIFGGHRDPDAGLYATSSPTASTLGHNLLNFVAVQMGWVVHYEDVSAAFLQGKELPRTEKVYVRVPAGYPEEVAEFLLAGLEGGSRPDLVQLTKAGFGLPESPRLWYLEYKDTIEDLGLRELALVPGLFRAFHPDGTLRAMASFHVDDTRYAGDESSQVLWDALHQKLKFGKLRRATEGWPDGWQKFCGLWEKQCPTTCEMWVSMQEYVKSIPLARGRDEKTLPAANARGSSTPTASGDDKVVIEMMHDQITGVHEEPELSPEERKLIGSIVGQLNWAARQGRYDLSFVSSMVQQLAGQGRAEALKWVNSAVRRAREGCDCVIRRFPCALDEMLIVSVSDAAYGAMPNGGSQGGTLVMIADPAILAGPGPVYIVEATSSKIQRVVRCSMSAEVSSLATAFEHGDYVRAVWAELVDHTFKLGQWKLSAAKWRHLLVTDAKTGYDAIASEVLPSDRKIAIDVGVLREGLLEPCSENYIRWVPGSEMPGDGLTKWAHNQVLTKVMCSGEWSLVDTPEAQELRRLAATKRTVNDIPVELTSFSLKETVTERPDENCRKRNVVIMYYLEDGTMSMSEPRIENSGIVQGLFLRRQRVERPEGGGIFKPSDFRCGAEVSFFGRTYHITGCDRFTRWYFSELGLEAGEDEEVLDDAWHTNYKLRKCAERGALPSSKFAVEQKTIGQFQMGAPPVSKKLTQFVLNDRKVLRFKGYWDDNTLYGARIYFNIHYYLADNTMEFNEAHCRNSGRYPAPIFFKRGVLKKKNVAHCVPAMLSDESGFYRPEDLRVGESIDVWGRKVVLFDCDDFTQKFYKDYMGINQRDSVIDVSEKPMRHLKHHGSTIAGDCFKHVLPYLGWRMLLPNCSVAAVDDSTYAISETGQLVCFGSNRAPVPPDLGPVVAVAAGFAHTCAVKASGELVCFGYNAFGQCDVPPDLGPVLAAAAGYYHTCAVKASGDLVCFGYNADGQCDVPPDLGPVLAAAAGYYHTCAVKASGDLVCFSTNTCGQCDVPPDLGPVVAVAARSYHTCAVKASGELVCFGSNDDGQCDVPPGFKVRLAPQSICAPTPDQIQEVLQPVHHEEPAADISQEEGAAIVAEQEASLIAHNIGFGWHGNNLQTQMPAALTRVVRLTLSRSHRQLDTDLEHSPTLRQCRRALEEEGLHWRLKPSGAKIFMEPLCFRAIRGHLSTMQLRPCDILVIEDLEEEVMQVVRQLPYSLRVFPRSSQNIAFADSDGEVVLVSTDAAGIPRHEPAQIPTALELIYSIQPLLPLLPPPHQGVGKEEDSLISCQMINVKPPKVDLEKLMVYTGEVLRFEAKMINGQVIAYYPHDDEVAVFEVPVRNSGHWTGKFADKRRMINPATGQRFKLSDLRVGTTVTMAGQPLYITRADERCLQFLEARPKQFPYADPIACAKKLAALKGEPEMEDPDGVDPDRLKELALSLGLDIVDHEIVTVLRRFGVTDEDGNLRILGPAVLETAAARERPQMTIQTPSR
ncbi:EF-hand domain-containing protein 1 [Symbiodinium microadriaticum]|uniref:EF-hand domain-containing protein 1 n=1 Tax=Symbiodinium microadriaticum TaxID=2951 RepID=A0A1Q9DFQ2_SYMMI|nr:EF-hand domain-containing protein 1 [Symbiodinium microadriaticum]